MREYCAILCVVFSISIVRISSHGDHGHRGHDHDHDEHHEEHEHHHEHTKLYSKELDVESKAVPFDVELPDGFAPGSKLTIKGTPHIYNPDRFEIALKCGPGDQALYLNPRLEEGIFVRDSLKNDTWENILWNGPLPFEAGKEFTVEIECKEEGFRIAVDDSNVPFFEHRKSPDCIKSLYFKGDVSISEVRYEPTKAVGSSASSLPHVSILPNIPDLPNSLPSLPSRDILEFDVKGKAVPFEIPLKNGLPPGSKLNIKGTPLDDFWMDLECGSPSDIALHLAVRFYEGVFVKNSRRNNSWDKHEERSELLFKSGEDFNLHIESEEDGFWIIVNGANDIFYKHRLKPEKISSIHFYKRWFTITISGVEYTPPSAAKLSIYSKELEVKGKPLPYELELADGFSPGSKLIIKGTPLKNSQFRIGLKSGSGDQALNLNPRLAEGVFVRNSLKNETWGKELRSRPVLFAPGTEFKLQIECREKGYRMLVSGSAVPFFEHRIRPDSIYALLISGDVNINSVTYAPAKWRSAALPGPLDIGEKGKPKPSGSAGQSGLFKPPVDKLQTKIPAVVPECRCPSTAEKTQEVEKEPDNSTHVYNILDELRVDQLLTTLRMELLSLQQKSPNAIRELRVELLRSVNGKWRELEDIENAKKSTPKTSGAVA